MLEIALLAFLTYRNSLIAKAKDQNVALWAVYTVVAFFAFAMLGTFMVIFVFGRDQIDMNAIAKLDSKAAQLQLEKMIIGNPLHAVTIWMFAFGGYLLVRSMLEKKQVKKDVNLKI